MCEGCLEKSKCLDWALATKQPFGIWGGKTERERREILRERRALKKAKIDNENRLAELTAKFCDDGAERLGNFFTVENSFLYSDVSKMLEIKAATLRTIKLSNKADEDLISRLAELAAFVTIISEVVEIPASWMSRPFFDNYTIAPKHVYSSETATFLIDIASGLIDPERWLDENIEDWREDYHSRGYRVAAFDDGTFGVILRNS